MSITREQAETILATLRAQYGIEADDEYGPKLMEDWMWFDTPTRWALVWEEGPYDWALRFGEGGFNEEIFNLALDEFGNTAEGRAKAIALASEKPAGIPEGLWVEAVTGWAVSILER